MGWLDAASTLDAFPGFSPMPGKGQGLDGTKDGIRLGPARHLAASTLGGLNPLHEFGNMPSLLRAGDEGIGTLKAVDGNLQIIGFLSDHGLSAQFIRLSLTFCFHLTLTTNLFAGGKDRHQLAVLRGEGLVIRRQTKSTKVGLLRFAQGGIARFLHQSSGLNHQFLGAGTLTEEKFGVGTPGNRFTDA